MSGVEIVGFLLGGFPLLISAAEHYKEGFEPLLKWKRFRKEFIAFIDAVDIEKQLFHNMLERFLMSADVPYEELCLFMNNPEYEGWQSKELVSILRGRLGPSYDAFMSTVRKMNQLMADLQELLCLKNGTVEWADEGASRWDYQLKRIRLSFSKRGVRTVEALETHNRKLRELLDSSDRLESMKVARKDTSWGNVFESIRQHATSLHTAIKNSWNCNCNTTHHGDLQLRCRSTDDESSTFHMTFDILDRSHPPKICRRELAISKRERAQELLPCRTPSPSFSIESSMTYTDHLRQNFEVKSSSQLSVVSRPILTPSESSLSSSYSSFLDAFSRSDFRQTTNTSISCMTETEIVLTGSSSRNWLSKPKKSKKSVSMQVPSSVELQAALQAAPMTSPKVSPNLQPNVQIDSEPAATIIDDLCAKIRSAIKPSSLGNLGNEQHIYEITCLQGEYIASREDSCISLDVILRDQGGVRLSRRQRYKIAHIVASSVLQLQSTPWLIEKLDKKSIVFYKKGAEVSLEHPYLRHGFNSNKSAQCIVTPTVVPAVARFAARNSLSNLGIILLELCFGQVIERQEFRSAHLGSDGKPHASTDFMTARDWADTVCEEDPQLEPIIKSCVNCIFEEKADWANKKFTQAVYCSVIQPLEEINNKWATT